MRYVLLCISKGIFMNEEKALELIKARTYEDGGKIKLSCLDAHKIAEKENIKLAFIGKLCNRENIRISNCELGCFK